MNNFGEQKVLEKSLRGFSTNLKSKYFYKPPVLSHLEVGKYEKNNYKRSFSAMYIRENQ